MSRSNPPLSDTAISRRGFLGMAALAGAAFMGRSYASELQIPESGPVRDKWITDMANGNQAKLFQACCDHCARYFKDYTGTLISQDAISVENLPENEVKKHMERLPEGTPIPKLILLPKREITFKFRQEPFSVAFNYVDNPPEVLGFGIRRLIYVEGQNGGKMLVFLQKKVNGLAVDVPGCVRKDPNSDEAKQFSRVPFIEFGLYKGAKRAVEATERAIERQAAAKAKGQNIKIEQSIFKTSEREEVVKGEIEITSRPANEKRLITTCKRRIPAALRHGSDLEIDFDTAYFEVDHDLLIISKFDGRDEKSQLLCSYEIKLDSINQGLTDEDFKP